MPERRDWLTITVNGYETESLQDFRMQDGISSEPVALLDTRDSSNLEMVSTLTVSNSKRVVLLGSATGRGSSTGLAVSWTISAKVVVRSASVAAGAALTAVLPDKLLIMAHWPRGSWRRFLNSQM